MPGQKPEVPYTGTKAAIPDGEAYGAWACALGAGASAGGCARRW